MVIRQVRVAAKNVEGATRFQDPRRVAEPAAQLLLELLIGKEVILEWPILGTQLLLSRFGFFGVPGQIEGLMVLRALK